MFVLVVDSMRGLSLYIPQVSRVREYLLLLLLWLLVSVYVILGRLYVCAFVEIGQWKYLAFSYKAVHS